MSKISGSSVYKSYYVTMPDGTKIALDLWLPRESNENPKIPSIVRFTRYWRSYELSKGNNPEEEMTYQPIFEIAKKWNSKGYALVNVDTRGSGASFGYRDGEYSKAEVEDLNNIVKYISEQKWSNGVIITEGTSYSANLSILAALQGEKALKVTYANSPDFDGYAHLMAPGGIPNVWLSDTFGGMITALDMNDIQKVLEFNPSKGGNNKMLIKGVRPVDEDIDKALLNKAIDEHKENKLSSMDGEDFTARDSSEAMLQTIKRGTIMSYVKELTNAPTVFIYKVGWFDAGTVAGAIAFFNNCNAKIRLLIGPWNHGGRYLIDPINHKNPVDLDFDISFEGMKNEIENAIYCGENNSFNKVIQYYTIGEEKLKSTCVWPPNEAEYKELFLTENNLLSNEFLEGIKKETSCFIDLKSSTGKNNRWHTQIGSGKVILEDRSEEDKKLLIFDSVVLTEDTEITGDIEVALYIKKTQGKGAIFVYFEIVSPDGEVVLITEGQLNFDYVNKSKEPIYKGSERNFFLKEKNTLLNNNPNNEESVDFVELKLLPISILIPKGYKIRVAIAGADKDTFKNLYEEESFEIKVLHDLENKSLIRLPIIKR